jgi:hypothetical protein
MKHLVLLIVLLASACAPSAEDIQSTVQASIAQTETARPTATKTTKPTNTPKPTATKRPTPTKTPAPSMDELRQGLLDALVSDLGNIFDVESVSVVRFNDGALEIELKTIWASKDHQPDVSWELIQVLAPVFAEANEKTVNTLAGGPFVLALTTYATDGDYRYQSSTDYDTLQKIASKSMSHDEWIVAAEAGFK